MACVAAYGLYVIGELELRHKRSLTANSSFTRKTLLDFGRAGARRGCGVMLIRWRARAGLRPQSRYAGYGSVVVVSNALLLPP